MAPKAGASGEVKLCATECCCTGFQNFCFCSHLWLTSLQVTQSWKIWCAIKPERQSLRTYVLCQRSFFIIFQRLWYKSIILIIIDSLVE